MPTQVPGGDQCTIVTNFGRERKYASATRTCRHRASVLERQQLRRHSSDVRNRWVRAQTLLDAHRQILELADVIPTDDVTVPCHVQHLGPCARLVFGMRSKVVEDPGDA